jgi:uncharacterized surface protein with fasciclin (FAS1) repeats
MRFHSLAGIAATALILSSVPSARTPAGGGDFLDVLAQSGQFTTLLTAIDAAGLTSALEGPGPLTVFAPTDRAFAELPDGAVEALVGQPNVLAAVLKYHVLSGAFQASDVLGLSSAPTLAGEEVKFTVLASGGLQVNKANVIVTDVAASNGVAHVIDRVLIPDFSVFGGARFDLVQLVSLLNIKFDEFHTLLAAVAAADLGDALSAPGALTLFAPTDRAFAKLPAGLLDSLLADPATLAKVLTYHVVPQELFAVDVASLPGATTLLGQDVRFQLTSDGKVYVNNARVVLADIDAKNGVVHAINEVLIPNLGP